MKRLITFICLIVIIFAGYYFIVRGLEIGDSFNISNYKTIEKKSRALTKKAASYDKKNKEEYKTATDNLDSSIKSFEASKLKYEEILAEMATVLNESEENETVEEIIYSDKEKYKVDFLLVVLGEYGIKHNVDVFYQLTTSQTVDPNSSTMNYFLADLKFTITGEYMNVADFISELENDTRLEWEIKNFQMESGSVNGYNGVSATFTIKDVPIDSNSYIASNTTIVEANTTTDGNTVDTNTTATTTHTTTDSTNTVATNTVN